MAKQWIDPQATDVPDDLQGAVSGHRLVAESLVRRGITKPESALRFLDADLYQPSLPAELPDLDKAVHRLEKAVRDDEPILVWGDFDVDGQTSTALLVSALRDLGAKVQYHIPNRFREGHGIHLPTLKPLLNDVGVLLTCDTGITAHNAVDYAQSVGVDVVITDHHTLPDTLPNAYACVNPMRLDEGHPLRELPGVGTAYKVVEALYGEKSSEHLLDLVAMGIVADVMVQVDDTRYLLQRGLELLRENPRPGLLAMMTRAEVLPAFLTEMDIGFSLAPRLNALGRLADANPAVELLTSDDSVLLAERINELEGLNQRRRFLTRQVYESAKQQIEGDDSLLKYAVLVVTGEDWHTGVVGIVASRLAEDYLRPVIVLSEINGVASGSARSIEGVNIVEAIRSQANLLNSFGGHNMAAGLSLSADNVFAFRRGISSVVREMIGEVEIQPTLQLDGILGFDEIDLSFAEDISLLAPFGNGNPPLTLATKNVNVKSRKTMGSRGDHLSLQLEDAQGNQQRVVWWFGDVNAIPQGNFDIAYTVRENVFRGNRDVMVEWLDARPIGDSAIEVSTKPAYEIVDYRRHEQPKMMLEQVKRDNPDALIWSEGDREIDGMNRYQLEPAETLIVWTVPASVTMWQAGLNVVQPQRILLFGNVPDASPKALIETLVGLAKYAINHKEGIFVLNEFATYTGQTERAIRAGLDWIQANTAMRFYQIDDEVYEVEMGEKPSESTTPQLLKMLLDETSAYRRFWLRQDFNA